MFALVDGRFGIVATRTARGGGPDRTERSGVLFARTVDFLTFEEVGLVDLGVDDGATRDGRPAPVAVAADVADFRSGNVVEVSDEIAAALRVRFGRIVNTTVAPPQLPPRVELAYSDGSTAIRAVEWDEVDTSTAGSRRVRGLIRQPLYPTPFADERADPSIVPFTFDGRRIFIMIATEDYMMNCTDPSVGPHMPIRVAERIEDLSDDAIAAGRCREIDLLVAGDTDAAGNVMTGCFWAPEIHVIDGNLSILFMPCYDADGKPDMWTGRASIIQLRKDEDGNDLDPREPGNWTHAVPVLRADGSILNDLEATSLDMTHFEDSGTHYYSWQMLGSVFIATMDPADPTRLTSDPVRIIAPEYSWDNVIAEGPPRTGRYPVHAPLRIRRGRLVHDGPGYRAVGTGDRSDKPRCVVPTELPHPEVEHLQRRGAAGDRARDVVARRGWQPHLRLPCPDAPQGADGARHLRPPRPLGLRRPAGAGHDGRRGGSARQPRGVRRRRRALRRLCGKEPVP